MINTYKLDGVELMSGQNSRPLFRHLGPQERRNLALAALICINVVFIGLNLAWQGFFNPFGIDYVAFWSAGYLANISGYRHVYDLDSLYKLQNSVVSPPNSSLALPVFPAMILPVFLLPFQLLSLFPPIWSLIIWVVIQAIILLLYLNFVYIRMSSEPKFRRRILVSVMFSFPVWWTLVWGQINIPLLICIGEFMRCMASGKSFRAGLWLGGLWLKPQTLILVLPSLLLQRSWEALGGFFAMTLMLMVLSLCVGGIDAFHGLIRLWHESVHGLPSNAPGLMVNWRMVGIHLGSLLGWEIGWGIASVGLLWTVLAALYLWRRPRSPASPEFGVSLLGTMAATCAVTWHSHLHMMIILIPPLLYLLLRGYLPMALMDVWLFLMPALMLVGLVLDLMGALQILPSVPDIRYWQFLMAITGWGLNLYLLRWAVRQVRRLEEQE